jgi:Mg2+ and Co2+ transporter CorA
VVTAEYENGIRTLLCTEGGITRPEIDPDEIDRFIAVEGNLLWLDINLAEAKDLGLLKREFGFHDLALEDATRPHQRPKIDTFDGYTFLIFYAMGLVPGASGAGRMALLLPTVSPASISGRA